MLKQCDAANIGMGGGSMYFKSDATIREHRDLEQAPYSLWGLFYNLQM